MTLDEAITKIQNLPQRIADEGVAIMKEEVPHGETGELSKSIFSDINGNTIFVGTEIEYAKYVVHGRREVRPNWMKDGKPRKPFSLHWTQGGVDVFAMRSGPVKPNDFVERTAKRLSKMKFL